MGVEGIADGRQGGVSSGSAPRAFEKRRIAMKKPVRLLSLRREALQLLTRPEVLRVPVGGMNMTTHTATGLEFSCGCG
jgi:hypothetical protein